MANPFEALIGGGGDYGLLDPNNVWNSVKPTGLPSLLISLITNSNRADQSAAFGQEVQSAMAPQPGTGGQPQPGVVGPPTAAQAQGQPGLDAPAAMMKVIQSHPELLGRLSTEAFSSPEVLREVLLGHKPADQKPDVQFIQDIDGSPVAVRKYPDGSIKVIPPEEWGIGGAAAPAGGQPAAAGTPARVTQTGPEAAKFASLISAAAKQYGVPEAGLTALLQQESAWNPQARGPMTKYGQAKGLGQFIDSTAAEMGIDPDVPEQAIPAAAKYLRQQFDKFGSWPLALAAYNWGPGNLERQGVMAAPSETQAYVGKLAPAFDTSGAALAPDGQVQAAAAGGAAAGVPALPHPPNVADFMVTSRLTGKPVLDRQAFAQAQAQFDNEMQMYNATKPSATQIHPVPVTPENPYGLAYSDGSPAVPPALATMTERSRLTKEGVKARQATMAPYVLEDINRSAYKATKALTTGAAGPFVAKIGGTDAADLQELLVGIKANIAFDQLNAMRAASPTGAALGNVSDNDAKLAQSVYGSLEQAQSKEQFLRTLLRLRRVYNDIIHGPDGWDDADLIQGGESPDNPMVVDSRKLYEALPEGMFYVDLGDPNFPVKQKAVKTQAQPQPGGQ